MQTRLLKKVGERLALKGFNRAEFEKSYAQLELFEKILRYIEKKNECVMTVREKRFLKME